MSCATVDPAVLYENDQTVVILGDTIRTIAAEQAIILQNIEHAAHLREYKDARAFLLHVLE